MRESKGEGKTPRGDVIRNCVFSTAAEIKTNAGIRIRYLARGSELVGSLTTSPAIEMKVEYRSVVCQPSLEKLPEALPFVARE